MSQVVAALLVACALLGGPGALAPLARAQELNLADGAADLLPRAGIVPGSCPMPTQATARLRVLYTVSRGGLLLRAVPDGEDWTGVDPAPVLDALRQCRFRPALRQGQPVEGHGILVYEPGQTLADAGRVRPARSRLAPCAPSPSDYPAMARLYRQAGETRLRLDIDTRGRVVGVELLASSGNAELDTQTVMAAIRCRHDPGVSEDGGPAGGRVDVVLSWKLQ